MARSGKSQGPPPRDSTHFGPDEAAAAKERLQRRITELRSLNNSQADYIRKSEIALDSAEHRS